MRITKIQLVNYKPMLHNNIKDFSMDLTSPYQLILGTNGSGKSALLAELSPNPAALANYTKGGYKIIQLESHGNLYDISSTFKGAPKHSFIKNGEELNKGGTSAVQKELVKQELNYTADLHGIITGEERFSSMTTARRRELFTAMSDNDLTYAISTYNKLKGSGRDTAGAVKHINGRLTAESSKLLELSDLTHLEELATEMHSTIELLQGIREHVPLSKETLNRQLNSLEATAIALSKQMLSAPFYQPPGQRFKDVSDILVELALVQERTKADESLLYKTATELEELTSVYNTMVESGFTAFEELVRRDAELTAEILLKRGEISRFYIQENLFTLNINSEPAITAAMMALSDIPDNSDRAYTRETLATAKALVVTYNTALDGYNLRHSKLSFKVKSIEDSKTSECPSCRYTWREGFSEHELAGTKGDLDALSEIIANTTKDRDSQLAFIEETSDYITRYMRWKWVIDHNPSLQVLWTAMENDGCPGNGGRRHVPTLHLWMRDLETSQAIEALRLEQANIAASMRSVENLGQFDSENYAERSEALNAQVERLTVSVTDAGKVAKRLSSYKATISNMLLNRDALVPVLKQIKETVEQLVRVEKQEVVAKALLTAQNSLASTQSKLNEKDTLLNIVSDLQVSSDELSLDSEAYKLLVEELSPIDGLIAEQLTEVIGCIVGQVNDIVANVWTYELEVLPCGLDSGELDYKFPLRVRNNSVNDIPDVSYGSMAQKEMIDFAFKLVVMLYMNLTNYPLMADELGGSFDEQHRVNIMNYVKLLIESKRYSQLFMISHYATSHGSMNLAEICVLDSTNIVVPYNYNKHVKLG